LHRIGLLSQRWSWQAGSENRHWEELDVARPMRWELEEFDVTPLNSIYTYWEKSASYDFGCYRE